MELMERYLKEVGRYLAPRERNDILLELRSLLEDSLDARLGDGQSAENELVALLKEHGSPREVAASYGRERYLIGPRLYPLFMLVLRIGVIVLSALALVGATFTMTMGDVQANVFGYVAEGFGDYVNSILTFVGATLVTFALLEYFDIDVKMPEEEWDPSSLPPLETPGLVKPVEVVIGIAFGILALFLLNFFRERGGFGVYVSPDFDNPLFFLPVARGLISLMMAVVVGQIVIDINALRVGRWQVSTRLLKGGLDIVGAYLFYRVVVSALPAIDDFLAGAGIDQGDWPTLTIDTWFAVALGVIVISNGIKLIELTTNRSPRDWFQPEFWRQRQV